MEERVVSEIVFPLGTNEESVTEFVTLSSATQDNLLITGASGTGKSFYLQSVIRYLLGNYAPEQLNLWLGEAQAAIEFARYADPAYASMVRVFPFRDSDDSNAFIDTLFAEFLRRCRIIFPDGFLSSDQFYRAERHCFPRLLVISEHLELIVGYADPIRLRKLERMLSHANYVGMHFVCSALFRKLIPEEIILCFKYDLMTTVHKPVFPEDPPRRFDHQLSFGCGLLNYPDFHLVKLDWNKK